MAQPDLDKALDAMRWKRDHPGQRLPACTCHDDTASCRLHVEPAPQPERGACARKGCGRPWSEHDFGTFCP